MSIEIYNVSEDIVRSMAQTIFDSIKKQGNAEKLCLCDQCQLDTICYALNRVEPRYIVSNRGITRIDRDWADRRQTEADISALIYKGIRQVNHNQRSNSSHGDTVNDTTVFNKPVFDIPTIVGRLLDGQTFAPLTGVTVELRHNGEVVPMRSTNWQNPFTLIEHTPGAYSFWPVPIPAEAVDINKVIAYSLKVESPHHETIIHYFKIPAVSVIQTPNASRSQDRTFKIPDLYLFPPGEAEQNG